MSVCKKCGVENYGLYSYCSCDKNGTGESDGLKEYGLTAKDCSNLINAYNKHTVYNDMFKKVNEILFERVKQARQKALEGVVLNYQALWDFMSKECKGRKDNYIFPKTCLYTCGNMLANLKNVQ